MKGGDANGTQRKLDPDRGDFNSFNLRVLSEEKTESPR